MVNKWKILAIASTGLFMFTVLWLTTLVWGDVNFDGKISVADALLIAQYLVGNRVLSPIFNQIVLWLKITCLFLVFITAYFLGMKEKK